jgi:hypothetical protein
MSFWRRVTCALVALVACAANAAAQAGLATLSVSVTLPDGAAANGARIEIAQAGPGALRTAVVDAAHPIAVLPVTPGPHRIRVELPDYRTAEETRRIFPQAASAGSRFGWADGGMADRRFRSRSVRNRPTQTNLGSEWLANLPSGRTVWSPLDTAHPFVISDRMDNGGLWSARPAKLGGRGRRGTRRSSGRRPRRHRIRVMAARLPSTPDSGCSIRCRWRPRLGIDTAGPGLAVSLIPKRPGEVERHRRGSQTPGSWQPDPVASIPHRPARYDHWTDASLSASGPITGRTGLFASIRGTNASRFEERDYPFELSNNIASLYGHLVGTAGTDRELRITTALSRATRPFEGRARYANRHDERGHGAQQAAAVERCGVDSSWPPAAPTGCRTSRRSSIFAGGPPERRSTARRWRSATARTPPSAGPPRRWRRPPARGCASRTSFAWAVGPAVPRHQQGHLPTRVQSRTASRRARDIHYKGLQST